MKLELGIGNQYDALVQGYSNQGPQWPSTAVFPAFPYLRVSCEASGQLVSEIIKPTTLY